MFQQLQCGTFYIFCTALRQMEILRCFGKWVIFVVRRTKAVLNINIFPIRQRIHVHSENLLDNMGRFRVRDKMIFVLRVNQIPIGSLAVYTLPALGFGLFDSPDFLGGIAGIKLIEPVPSVEKKDAGQ